MDEFVSESEISLCRQECVIEYSPEGRPGFNDESDDDESEGGESDGSKSDGGESEGSESDGGESDGGESGDNESGGENTSDSDNIDIPVFPDDDDCSDSN